ncbi:hypothetical protein PVK06_012304 [Gossypium arboreum]|uniref:Uncharacterized protein n=1 Tax=Gossypium arboreum TaxID=29729 RepID=A0ABR0QC34_GOSAR|nr:hypothetical protein PVK06_012304 [Gossypium arboreum]
MGATQDHPRLDSNMIAHIILLMVKASPQIEIPMLIVNILNQYQYTLTYYKSKLTAPGCIKGYELVQHVFHQKLNNLSTINAYGVTYVLNIPFNQWRQPYYEGLRYRYMTSNLAEYINLTESVYAGQIEGDGTFCDDVMQEIRRSTMRENMMYVVCHSRRNLNFQVTKHVRPDQKMSGISYRVNLMEGT